MAIVGEVIDDPVTHQQITYRETEKSSGGKLLRMEFLMRPGGFIVGGEHLHPDQEESFTVLTGTLKFIINGKEQDVPVGQKVVIPPGTPHVWWNGSGENSTVTCEFRLSKDYENYFETIFGLARDGKTNAKGFPHLLQAAVLYYDFRHCVQPAALWFRLLLKILLPIVAPIGKLFGYRSIYPKYHITS